MRINEEVPTSDDESGMSSAENAETREAAADDSGGFFRYIKTKWIQVLGWRSPGLYDDIKVDPVRNFNNNELRGDADDVNFHYSNGSTPLTRALKSNDVTAVEELLRVPGIDLNFAEKLQHGLGCVYNAPKRPPLVVAVQSGYTELVQILLEAGANVDSADGENYTALYHSVYEGNMDMTRLLLQYNAILDCPEGYYDPIHVACQHGKFDIVKLLVGKGCNIEPEKCEGCVSPLRSAVEISAEDICLHLIKNGADINKKDNCALELFLRACCLGLSRVVALCIEKGCDVNMATDYGASALMLSTKLCNDLQQRSTLSLFQMPLSTHTLVLNREMYTLCSGRLKTAKRLCESGCLIDTVCVLYGQPMTALSMALKFHNLPVAVLLLKHGAKWDEVAYTQLKENYGYLCEQDNFKPPYVFILRRFIPKIQQILDHKTRMKFSKDTDGKFIVPCLKDVCRQVIRNQLKQFTDKNLAESTSILPLIPSLKLPALLNDYLCYTEINEEDFDYIFP